MADKLGALKPQKKIELYSGNYFAACTVGGIIACGPTHTMVTPLDLVCAPFAQLNPQSSDDLANSSKLANLRR